MTTTVEGAYGTANYHKFEFLPTIITSPSSVGEDTITCTNSTDPYESKCPSDRECCAAQYSPSGYGCTTESGDGCCLLGAALSPSAINPSLPNCLIMGDSVSIGYVVPVQEALKDVCNVQHSPWDVSNGGWSQSQAALACLDIMLKTANQEAVSWDVIFFNNGLHDLTPNTTEAVDAYTANMDGITKTLLGAADKVLYGLTTPQQSMFNEGNFMVEDLNKAATGVMQKYSVPVFDLYSRVANYCGGVPYVDCEICNASPCDFHYTGAGSAYIAVAIEEAILSVLEK